MGEGGTAATGATEASAADGKDAHGHLGITGTEVGKEQPQQYSSFPYLVS